MVLHIFAKGLNQRTTLLKCQTLVAKGDAIIFVEDGVYWASTSELSTSCLDPSVKFYYLAEDADTRGIKRIHNLTEAVDYAGFVSLTANHQNSVSWF